MQLENPIGRILRSFCHVEWYEVDELAELVKGGVAKFDIGALKNQFEYLIANPQGIANGINEITANEFESDAEARIWLERIYQKVFY